MLKKKAAGSNAYELVDDFDQPIISLTSIRDKTGALRVTATVTGSMADEIIDGLRLLGAVRSVTRPGIYL